MVQGFHITCAISIKQLRETQMQLANVFAETYQWAQLAKGKPIADIICQSGRYKLAEGGE